MKNRYLVRATASLSFAIFLLSGCGGSESLQSSKPTIQTKDQRASFYINKGNFVEVASFAYKRATDPSFTTYAMDVEFPRSDDGEAVKPSAYNIEVISADKQLKKIVVQNYQNVLEVKIIDGDRVNVIFKDAEFTVDEEMTLNDFIALQ